jgi:hypothetical protein
VAAYYPRYSPRSCRPLVHSVGKAVPPWKKTGKSVTSGTQSSGRVHSWINGIWSRANASVITTEIEYSANSLVAGYYEVPGDWRFRYASSPQAGASEMEAAVIHRPAAHVEADGAERYEILVAPNTLPASPRSIHVEADGTERYKMHAVERGSSDIRASQAMSPTLGARSTPSHHHHASSPLPCVLPQRLTQNDSAICQLAADSPKLSSQDQRSPMPSALGHRPSHKRNISSTSSGLPSSTPSNSGSPDPDALEAASGLGCSNSRR